MTMCPSTEPGRSSAHLPLLDGVSCKSKVMLVDDVRVNRVVIGSMLRRAGMDVVEACNGVECLNQVAKHGGMGQFALILMDLQMPILDGWSTTEKLRSIEAGTINSSRLPIVACTAEQLDHDMPAKVQDSLLSGVPIGIGSAVCTTASCYNHIATPSVRSPSRSCGLIGSPESRALACGMDECMAKPMSYTQLCTVLAKYIPCFEMPSSTQTSGSTRFMGITASTGTGPGHSMLATSESAAAAIGVVSSLSKRTVAVVEAGLVVACHGT